MNTNIFLGAILVFVGNIATTFPYLRSAFRARQLAFWNQIVSDDGLGNARDIAMRIRDRMKEISEANFTEYFIMFLGVAVGLCGALLMSWPP
jgi:hypothetical protein